MKSRWIGYAAWLLLAACLYFFENNTGTRVVLLCSLLFPLIPPLRTALFSPDESTGEKAPETLTAGSFARREAEEPGDIRPYVPGDPVRRIHWKLSAKRDELLIRETAAEEESAEEEKTVLRENQSTMRTGKKPAAVCAAGILLCILLLLGVPDARQSAQALCNRVFTASEAVNTYVYRRFPVPESQSVLPAAALLLCILILLAAMTAFLRSRTAALGITAAFTLFQVWFGLAFPAWITIPVYGLSALWMLKRPASRRSLVISGALVLIVSGTVLLLMPGVDAATETASETVRDHLTRITEQITGTSWEDPEGETETRHIHPRSLETGDRAAEAEQEFRLETVEEEQISRPDRINWIRAILLLVLAVALVTLPFMPFLLLNARRKKAREIRETFTSENISEAVQAAFRQIIRWLEATGRGGGNRLFREWSSLLPDDLPDHYPERFARCAADYEEAVYSCHTLPEQKRREVLDLLEETEAALWNRADRKQRLYLKYWMCLHE
jgi:hypothetical protein